MLYDQIYRMIAPRYRTGYGYWYVYRLDRDHWPVQGLNALEVALTEYDDEVTVEPYVRDVELEPATCRARTSTAATTQTSAPTSTPPTAKVPSRRDAAMYT